MNNPAYDSGYLNSAKLSGRYLFKLIARNCSDCFGIIYKYMKSDYRSALFGFLANTMRQAVLSVPDTDLESPITV